MPLFLINARDKADSTQLRLKTRSAHLEWARNSLDHIHMAGPVLAEDGVTMIGSTFIIEAGSLADAQTWADSDPYNLAGLFETVEITAFRWLLGKGLQSES